MREKEREGRETEKVKAWVSHQTWTASRQPDVTTQSGQSVPTPTHAAVNAHSLPRSPSPLSAPLHHSPYPITSRSYSHLSCPIHPCLHLLAALPPSLLRSPHPCFPSLTPFHPLTIYSPYTASPTPVPLPSRSLSPYLIFTPFPSPLQHPPHCPPSPHDPFPSPWILHSIITRVGKNEWNVHGLFSFFALSCCKGRTSTAREQVSGQDNLPELGVAAARNKRNVVKNNNT